MPKSVSTRSAYKMLTCIYLCRTLLFFAPYADFSQINELFVRLYGRFHHVGYEIPNKAFDGKEIRPDVSVGKCFATYLKLNYSELAGKYKSYKHKFPSGMELDARQYENALLPIFIQYVDEEWIPKHAEKYFSARDTKALDYLPKLLDSKKKSA